MFGQFMKEKRAYAQVLHKLLEGSEYRFDEPWQLTSESLSALVPILQNSVGNRDYLVAQEIPPEKISVIDSGQIGNLRAKVAGVQKPVFVRAGTVFKGNGTQSRTSSMGMCLEPEKEDFVNVFCVHASHGISMGSHFSMENEIAPRKVEDVLTSPIKNQSNVWASLNVRKWRAEVSQCSQCGSASLMQDYEAGLVCMTCGAVVSGVSMLNRSAGSGSRLPSDRLADNMVANLREMKEFNQRIEDMLSKIPADLENQVGIVMIDSKGVYGLEIFDHPGSWRAFSKSIVRNYADVLAKERAAKGLFALRTDRIPDAIKEFLQKAQNLSENSVYENKIGKTCTLSGELIGEYSMLRHELIHLILKRRQGI